MFVHSGLWFEGVKGNRQRQSIMLTLVRMNGWVEASSTQVCFVWTFVPDLFREICVLV